MLTLLLACTPKAPPTPAATPVIPPPIPMMKVDVERAGESWTVRYTTPEPVAGLWFTRGRHRFRNGWTIETDGVTLEEVDYGEVLLADAPRSEFVVRFETDSRNREKDYKLNLEFSDGSRLLYTGHLSVHPLVTVPDGVQRAEGELPGRWTFRGEDRVLVYDRQGEGSLTIADPRIDRRGTYVFFGGIEPFETASQTTVLDPGFPAWLNENTTSRLQGLFDRYGAWTGHPLDFHPLIFISYNPEGEHANLKGGTLPGLMQLSAMGEPWQTASDEGDVRWFIFLAHEAFHFWNSQMFEIRGQRWEEWVSEGLSDYYARRAARAFDVVDDAGYNALIDQAAERCTAKWEDGPMLEGKRPYGTYYACGSLILARLDRQLTEDGGLDSALRKTWANAEETGGWSTSTLLEVVQERQGPQSIGWITDALYAGPRQPIAELVESWRQELQLP